MTATVSEESATTISPTTLNKITEAKESLPVTTSAVICTTSLTMTTLGTTGVGTTMSGTQEGETTAAPPTPATAPTMRTLSETHHNTATQTPSHLLESAPSTGTATAQSPETTAAHSTARILSSSGTTKSSAKTGASQASPKHTQSSSPRAGVCALDEYPASRGVCMCNDSYYAHSELSTLLVALHCQPQKIEVVLISCFLKTHHWNFSGAFSGCSSVSKIEEGHRVQVFRMEKKEVNLWTPPLCTGDTIVILGIFTDPQLSSPLGNRPAPLGKPLYVVLRATSSDPDRFALVANEVFASSNISRMGTVKDTYHFVKESCPVSSQLLQGLGANGVSLEVTPAFNLFRFLTSDTLYLHGRVTLSDKRAGRPCQPTCSQKSPPGRNRAWEIREQEGMENRALWMVFGPIRISGNWIIWGPP
ncbi:uncharacterized protein [Equus przewalskii]|uniref:ZP-C domain-containing protein n=1 Tax=Equus przewalskii TaxID=9798 RepID=A0ABM4NP51_EQUPR